ncbi:class F sortase [Pseudonocardia yuanmonensis]|uniref:Class F sortase n=1 Tax=Pseudonocardia yuanmonensis TaxID=1095914 RepID=A0ABP8WS33_9PSEU
MSGTHGPRRGTATAALVVGLTLAVGSGTAWTTGPAQPGPSIGAARSTAPAQPVTVSPAPAGGPPRTSGSAAAVAPTHLRVDRADTTVIDAPLLPVGVDDAGRMSVPEDVSAVGWYRFGPAPGDPRGSAVLAGHVDDRIQGPGAFHGLARLSPGDRLTVALSDARVLAYVVADVGRVAKAALPTGELFGRDGPPRLTLVTCGGPFDRGTRDYRDNVVVTAVPDAR